MNLTKKSAILLTALGLTAGTVGTIAIQTHAQSASSTPSGNSGFHNFTKPAAVGTVTAINGSSLTLSDKRSGATYTVDASGATIQKFPAPGNNQSGSTPPAPTNISVSDIKVGDVIAVDGTVSGSDIVATKILDGLAMGRHWMGGMRGPHGTVGTVSGINGNTVTLSGKNGTTYTVDLSNSQIEKLTPVTAGDIKVGDQLNVEGKVSGSSITASHVLDGLAFPKAPNTNQP